VAIGEVFSEDDYDQIVDALVHSKKGESAKFDLDHLPQVAEGDSPVSLVPIAQPEHVNALQSDKPLTFEATGVHGEFVNHAATGV
jgi:hypothetical protein